MGLVKSKLSRRAAAYAISEPDSPSKKGGAGGKAKLKAAAEKQSAGKSTKHAITKLGGNIKSCPGPPRPKLDPKDFMFTGLRGQTKVKLPGSINGQQFIIDDCEGCDLYVLDHCAMVTVDNCKDCRIFVGPTESSIFIRDSSGCSCAVICRQLRTRDCKDCSILLHCRTKPIIESSSELRFGCYSWRYKGLQQQLEAAKMSVLHNFWSYVYDFTPNNSGGSSGGGGKSGSGSGNGGGASNSSKANWQFLEPEVSVTTLLANMPKEVRQLADNAENDPPSALTTWGARPQAPLEQTGYLFVLFPGQHKECTWQFIAAACRSSSSTATGSSTDTTATAAAAAASSSSSSGGLLLHTNEALLSSDLARQLCIAANWDQQRAAAMGSAVPAVGLEVAIIGEADHYERLKKLAALAEQLGGCYTVLETPADMFRHLGVDG